MVYTSFSLNGTWEMDYCEAVYKEKKLPCFDGTPVQNAVPGYWEDMTDSFAKSPFFCRLKINPEYGIQRYPIAELPPDMALPNVVGNFFYKKTFEAAEITSPAVIHFDGVQNSVSVWLNGTYLGRHEGYSTPFDIEIPRETLKVGDNTIVLSVSNHRLEGYGGEPISGLTSRAANECTGGITGDIELRVYSCPLRGAAVLVSEDCKKATVKLDIVEKAHICWSVRNGDTVIKSGEADGDFTFDTHGLELWSPENPQLYTLKITCGDASLEHQFGIRRLVADGVHFRLNGTPYYLRGICEHCYFPETIHPAHDGAYYRSIVKCLKKLGFNFIRFHTYIPEEEYMQAADELGMLVHVECPNNTTVDEWRQIVAFCRRHTSVVIYCCGNELLIDEPFADYLHQCADEVHSNTDSLFSPLSALRGLEYHFVEPGIEQELVEKPFLHNPRRFETVGSFSDMYSSYANGQQSYFSIDTDVATVDSWSVVYNKPRVSHEICIDGTYTDLSLKDRYKDTRIGKTEMFTSIEKHLRDKGMLHKAPLYFKNSSEWQRRVRKFCFEATRRCENMAGYDFLGPIDTHWHTFGYDVGMMNEFYELKPGETVRNVLMYNSPTVLLTDLGKKANFLSGDNFSFGIYTSHYGDGDIRDAALTIRLMCGSRVERHITANIARAENGKVTKLLDVSFDMPQVKTPREMKLFVTLESNSIYAENEWELYLFPEAEVPDCSNVIIAGGMSAEQLADYLNKGKDVVLLGAEPFAALPTSFRISLAGRTTDNLATVIYDHPLLKDMPHDGFCGWQFANLLEGGKAVCFENDDIPFDPIIEVVSTHKNVIRQAAMFEYRMARGRLLVCSFNLDKSDPAAQWLKSQLVSYVQSDSFNPSHTITEQQLYALSNNKITTGAGNTNLAFNPNDKTAKRKNN